MRVDSAEGDEARLRLETASGLVAEYTYQAASGAIASFTARTPAGAQVYALTLLGHGTGHVGLVRVPLGQDLLWCHGRASVAIAVESCAAGGPSAPIGTVEIPAGYDGATVALVLNPGAIEGRPASLLQITVTEPQGRETSAWLRPGEPAKMVPWTTADPAGTWRYESLAGGPGAAIVEGVAYRLARVRLPAGCVEGAVPGGFAATSC